MPDVTETAESIRPPEPSPEPPNREQPLSVPVIVALALLTAGIGVPIYLWIKGRGKAAAIVAGVIVVIGFIGAATDDTTTSGDSDGGSDVTASDTPDAKPDPKPPATAKLGDAVEGRDGVKVTASNPQITPALSNATADGVFLLVDVEFENEGDSAYPLVLGEMLSLRADGNDYRPRGFLLDERGGLVPPREQQTEDKLLQPNLPVKLVVFWDVPPDAADGAKVVVDRGRLSKAKSIALGTPSEAPQG